MHGSKVVSAIGKEVALQAKKGTVAFDKFTSNAKKFTVKAGKTVIGAFTVKDSAGSAAKSPQARKSSNASTPANKAKKAKRLAQRAARKANRGK